MSDYEQLEMMVEYWNRDILEVNYGVYERDGDEIIYRLANGFAATTVTMQGMNTLNSQYHYFRDSGVL